MRLLRKKVVLAPAVLVGAMAMGMPPASAQSFLENLFGGGMRNQRMEDSGQRPRSSRMDGANYGNATRRFQEQQARPQKAVRKAAPIAKISAPSYYNYKAAAL